VIAVNDSYLLCPWADMLYFADSRWWRWHDQGIRRKWLDTAMDWADKAVKAAFDTFAGEKVTIFSTGLETPDPAVHMLRNGGSMGLSVDPGEIRTGRTSGYQAMNIATLTKPRRVVLLGYDCRTINGRSHWFGDHPLITGADIVRQYGVEYDHSLSDIRKTGVEIVNATAPSAISVFPKMTLARALA
jgi:hypothetical protein